MSDSFYAGLCEQNLKTQGYMQGEINRLRRENARLQTYLDAVPAYLTEMEDQITLLEGLLRERSFPSGNSNG